MLALPKAVQAAFPCKPNQVPDRPWWSYAEDASSLPDYGRRLERTDGSCAYDPAPPGWNTGEREDMVRPIPHPGFRAGQVWASEDGSSIVIARFEGGPPTAPIKATSAWLSEETFSREYPYLMADPACPWLAPWSPAKLIK
jgi:hypothetical protein